MSAPTPAENDGYEDRLAAEIVKIIRERKRQGYGKAAICERSFEIEEEAAANLAARGDTSTGDSAMPPLREIQVFPMISDANGTARLVNSTEKQGEQAEFYDVMLVVRDEDSHEPIETHADNVEHENLSRSQAAVVLHCLEKKYPDASVEWLEERRPDTPHDDGWMLIDADKPLADADQRQHATPISFDMLKSNMPPLEWTQERDRWDSSQYEFVYTAMFLNHRYTIEMLNPELTWAVYVDNPALEPSDRLNKPIVDEQDHPSIEAAIASAEHHRVRILAEAMGIPVPARQEPSKGASQAASTSPAPVLDDSHSP